VNTATKVIIGIVIVGVVAIGGALAANKKPAATTSTAPAATSTHSTANETQSAPAAAASGVTIRYDSKGFEPAVTTVKAGDTVTVTNTESDNVQMDSDPHPTHTDEPELNVGLVKPGESKTFTITRKGTWGFHNHLDPSERGQIVVQ
jgi:plastocyanin